MLKDIEELIKRRKLTTLALHMTEYSREPAPVPLLAKTKHTAATATTTTTATETAAGALASPAASAMTTMAPLALATTTNTVAGSNLSTTPPITPPTPPPLNMARSQPLTPSSLLPTATPMPMHTPTLSSNNNTPATNLTTHASLLGLSGSGIDTSTTTPPAAAAEAVTATLAATTTSTTNTNINTLQDHYSLRWNNHQNHILRAFDALLQTKTLVDVTLVCAETSIRAHKMVLSACSPFFQRVFAETPCKHPVIVLKDFRGWVVQAIVDFMYRGEISVPQERLQTLIQAGESLQVRGLVESSVPEHTPTPAASPDDFGMLHDASLMSSELERCSSFDDEVAPSMIPTAGTKLIMPTRLFGTAAATTTSSSATATMTHMRRTHERKREREREEREREREMAESDQELQGADLCTSPMPRRKQARPRRRSGEMPHDFQDLPETNSTTTTTAATALAVSREARSADASPDSRDKAATAAATAVASEDVQRELSDLHAQQLAALQTVIKSELAEPMDDDEDEADRHDNEHEHMLGRHNDTDGIERDSGTGNDSHEHNESQDQKTHDLSHKNEVADEQKSEHNNTLDDSDQDDLHNNAASPVGMADDDEEEDIEELINSTNELRRKAMQSPCHSDGPEDLCTTKKDNHNDTSGHHSTSASDNECSPANNNNNSSKLKDNNQRIVLSLKDIRHLNKPSSSSTPNSSSNHPFAPPSLRDLRLDHATDSPCNMEALEAQMHAAAAAAVAAASAGAENPFQHMEHQMDLSLAAAAAAAAVSHQHSRERDHALREREREHRELQHQHNAFANSLLGPMGMPPFGPGGGGCGPNGPNCGPLGGQAPHERLEESMNRLSKEFGKEFAPSSPMSLPSHFNPPDGPPHPPSPLPFPGMSSALTLTPPHMFGLDSPLGLFPPGIDPGKLYNPLMEMSDPRDMPGGPPPFLKKKMPRPKGQHSAPRGGPPRSWTNSELTEALQHVWNKKMTTSQASRIFGIPYNSLLMYVRGKYGKSLKLEQLRKDCISGPPLEMLQMGISSNSGSSKSEKHKERKEREKDKSGSGGGGSGGGGGGGGGPGANGGDNGPPGLPLELELGLHMPGGGGPPGGPRSASSESDLLGGPNALFNPFNPQGFYPDFPGGFPGLPLSMLNLLPPSERHQHAAAAAAMHHMSGAGMDEDCKSDRSKQSSSLDEDYPGPLALNRDEHHRRSSEMLAAASAAGGGNPNGSLAHANGGGSGQD